ncbi:MAG: replication initiation and membrane attachment family protein [Bacilli bacterium]
MNDVFLPADKYKVINKTILSENDKKNLISFYMPIIGCTAVSLYLTLWQDLNYKEEDSEILIHRHLMTLLKESKEVIYQARQSLEAVGLLKTYVKCENVKTFIYELYSPLLPNEFFNHPILNIVLYNNIGSEEYDNLIKIYQKKKYDYSQYTDITKKMDEVYKTESYNIKSDIKDRNINNITLNSKINYDQISTSIPKNVMSDKALNKKSKELIDNLSFVYNFDTLKMIELIRGSLNEFGMIDKNALRLNARKSYNLSSNSLPTLVYRTQPEYLKKASGDNSLHAQIVSMFESISPYDFLKYKNKGAIPTNKDLKLVESLLVDLELPPAVVNVLLDYCLRKNNNKLTTAYVETIAGQWKRADLKTAEEAMKFAEKEHKKLNKKISVESKKITEPAWFNKKIETTDVSDQEQKELEELLKEFK